MLLIALSKPDADPESLLLSIGDVISDVLSVVMSVGVQLPDMAMSNC